MTPEFSKAAKSLAPLIPFYAVDCDDDGNKALCAEQVRQGVSTVEDNLNWRFIGRTRIPNREGASLGRLAWSLNS